MGMWGAAEDGKPLREGKEYKQGKREAEGVVRIAGRQGQLV